MRAAVCRSYGGPDVIEVGEFDAPALGAGQARVRVATAAVNFPDVLVVANSYQISVPTPFVPGSEFAGEVIEVAADVTAPRVGDLVFGSALYGGFAEEVVVPAAVLTGVPDGVALDVAAAFGVAHRTAYHSLRSVACLEPGDELVVLGAGGGVGLAAVQLGVAMGATVTAVASSPQKLAAAQACGATRLVDYKRSELRAALKDQLPGGSDVVLDPVGGDLSEPALRSLHYGGRFVTVGYAAGTIPRIPLNLVLLKGIRIVGFEFRGFATHHFQAMVEGDAALMDLLAAGRVTPYVEARFGLDDTVGALRHVAEGQAIGKVLLDIAAPPQPRTS